MRLKNIKVVGFKSFAHATTIPFPSNLSAIVGPNGCGKSNVIDAIRWVMGESSAKQLRGDAMSDVIFAGTTNRKPVGVASVELNFENTLGKLGGDYRVYNELSIKRQVTRDGGSNYYINNSKCRRRDITDIFLGTGLGPRSYAVIEQGMISRLVEAKPEDLRQFLEEAAGVSKYQARRKETLTHLAHTQDNLARLQDIKSELDSQIRALKKQASAADRYKDLQNRLQNSKIALYTLQFGHASHLHSQLADRETALQAQHSALMSQREQLEAQIQQHNEQLQAALANNSLLQQDWQHAERQLTEYLTSENMRSQQIKQLESERQVVQNTMVQLSSQLIDSRSKHAALQLQLQDAAVTDTYNHTLLELGQHINQLKQQLSQQQNTVAMQAVAIQSQKNQKQHLQSNVATATKTQQQLQAQLSKLTTSNPNSNAIADWQHELALHQAELKTLASQTAELSTQLPMQTERTNQMHQQRLADNQQLDTLKQEQTKLTAELGTQQRFLQQLHARIKASDANWPTLATVLKLTAAGSQYSGLIETLLGPWFSTSVCENDASIVPEHSLLLTSDTPPEPITLPIDATPLLSLVDSPRLAIAKHWYIAHNPISTTQLPALLACVVQHPALVITDRNGYTLMAGFCGYLQQSVYASSQDHTGMLTLPESIKVLENSCRALTTSTDGLSNQLNQSEQAYASELATLEQLKQQQQALQTRHTQCTHHCNLLTQKISHQQTQDALIAEQRLAVQQQLAACTLQIENNQAPLHHSDEQIASAELQLAELHRQIGDIQGELQQVQRNYNDTASKKDLALQKFASLQRQQQQTTQDISLLRAREQDQQNRITDIQRQSDQLQQASNPQQLDELQQSVNDSKAAWQQQQQAQQNLQTAIQALNQQRVDLQKTEASARSSLESIRLQCQQLQNKMDVANGHLSAMGASLQLKLIPLEAHELAQVAQLETDHQAQISSLQKKIEALGALNLAAPEELDSLLSRHQELDTQMQDLQLASDKLQSAMTTIDQETRNLFMDTFAKINTSLGQVFPKIFAGGHAELTLEEGWQSGVKLMAQPPGKRNSSISLLSGGEKTLTALALVFAIFALNPSPFCVLDEVDAPLDDANVKRYCNLVNSLAEQVQFIYITHNKIAMEMADTLLGVTMPEAGVSQVVSVSLQEAAHYVV